IREPCRTATIDTDIVKASPPSRKRPGDRRIPEIGLMNAASLRLLQRDSRWALAPGANPQATQNLVPETNNVVDGNGRKARFWNAPVCGRAISLRPEAELGTSTTGRSSFPPSAIRDLTYAFNCNFRLV